MGNTHQKINPWHGLAHPGWWLALGLLALNDHVLKGAGLLPGAVTGKLSDLAGLVVAPVLAAALLGARTGRGVAGAFALVAAGFAAVKVSPAASAHYLALLGAIGVRGRNVVDPTDLVALAALPLAWRLCAARPAAALRATRQGLAVALGGAACVATSQPGPDFPTDGVWTTSAIVANGTEETIEVRLRWVDGVVSCPGNDTPQGAFLRSVFTSEPLTVRLTAGQTFPLSRAAALRAIMPATPGAQAPLPTGSVACDAVLVQADNLPSAVVWLPSATQLAPARWTSSNGGSLDAPALVLRGSATSLTSERANGVLTSAPAEAPATCAAANTRYFVAADVTQWQNVRVLTTRVQPDGCTRLEAADRAAMSLCVPADAVPFRPGDDLRADLTAGIWTIRAARGAQLVVVPARPYSLPDGLNARASSCSAHSVCGAYAEQYEVHDGGGPIARNERVELRGARAYFGGAERVIVRPSACDSSPDVRTPGSDVLLNLAIVTGI